MKKGQKITLFGEAKEEVKRDAEMNYDLVNISASDVTFTDASELVVHGQKIPMNEQALASVMSLLHTPNPSGGQYGGPWFTTRVSPRVQGELLNDAMSQRLLGTGKRHKHDLRLRMKRGSNGNPDYLRVMATMVYKPNADNWEVMKRLEELGVPESAPCQFRFDNEYMALKVLTRDPMFYLGPNDPIFGGFSVENSNLLEKCFSFYVAMMRIYCWNGATGLGDVCEMKSKHVKEGLLLNLTKEHLLKAERAASKWGNLMLEARNFAISHPIAAIAVFSKALHFPSTCVEVINKAFYQEPHYSLFGIHAAMTRAAHDLPVGVGALIESTSGRILQAIGTPLMDRALRDIEDIVNMQARLSVAA